MKVVKGTEWKKIESGKIAAYLHHASVRSASNRCVKVIKYTLKGKLTFGR